VRFDLKADDGSSFTFRGAVHNDTLTGEFTISAWGVVKNAGSGTWQMRRVEP
jgi:hypothetical protein